MHNESALPLVVRALEDVSSARRALRHAGPVQWASPAADRFRAALEEADLEVGQVRVALERTVQPVAAADLDNPGGL